jgi:hypothetical protein|tara:strand:- start:128 stop:421 length:294 start_codon:yes stop_codon:yes gene_type:complete
MMSRHNKVEEVSKIIHTMEMEQVNEVIDHIKLRREYLSSKIKNNFRVGQKVFITSRRGVLTEAKVERIKRKNILVKTIDGTKWNCSPNVLKTEAVNA